jgi:subtilase family serine protease
MRTDRLRYIVAWVAAFFGVGLLSACAGVPALVSGPAPVSATHSAVHGLASSAGIAWFDRAPNVREVCPDTDDPTLAFCDALARTDVGGNSPYGYEPSDLQSAYNLPSATAGKHQVVAVVDAFNDPNVEADLFIYRNTFGLPVCSTLNRCFIRLNQRGQQRNYPGPDKDWAIETSVDIDMVSAACPNCKIMLVEADTNSWANLGASVDEAVKLGAHIVNNSYGALGKGAKASDYDHPGVVLLAAGGDNHYYGDRNQEPAAFGTVVAVGGTTLVRSSGGRGWTETVWEGTGSGCSKLPKPAWQHDTGCSHRTANDVAAVADPNTGVAVYDSYQESGWMQIGGTSVSSPINAAAFAMAGNASKRHAAKEFYEPANQQFLYDITSGANGNCSPAYLCNGEVGYDAPTGWGTPNGIGAY